MSIDADHDALTAASILIELRRFGGECRYDPQRKKVVYASAEAALKAYVTLQREEMERHRWLESERAHADLCDRALADWIRKYSRQFNGYWRKTHLFVPSEESIIRAQAC